MSAQSAQGQNQGQNQGQAGSPWNHTFGPLFRGGYSDQHLRVSDAERQAVADRLAEHYGEGRLDRAEFDDRAGRAMNAKTRGDLRGLFDDLPETGAPVVPPGGPTASPGRVRVRRGHPVLMVVLAVVVTLAAAHALVALTLPWLWLGLLALVLAVLAGRRPARPDRDR